ncbi:sugar phosphate nucleotidyltransferase [Oxalobacter formigenes]|uniref:sugar phosphate nucleotidyltransferase n=1 Tax=Oxalobacter formigenes TaxID=847 RepID=UPI0021BD3519|nr:sugar phosphate nucleotidyltransferase [Oxalobacter formigenes]
MRSYEPEYILVLAGDHIYKMDYSMLLLDHVESKSLCTVACIEVPREDASGFGVMDVDENRKITRFLEKPADPPGMPDNPDKSLASMGIYVFNADYLYRLLDEDCGDNTSSHDFGKDIIPKIVGQGNAMAHYFSMSCVPSAQFVPPYWRDVGTIDSFWSANLDLTSNMPQLNIYDEDWPIWTYQEQEPPPNSFPTHMEWMESFPIRWSQVAVSSAGSKMSNSILFSKVRVQAFCNLDQVVVLPNCEIGQGSKLKKVVIDRGCRIPEGTIIGEDPELDAQRFYRSPNGVVLVTQEMFAKLYNFEHIPKVE